jgi:hypothetical protein
MKEDSLTRLREWMKGMTCVTQVQSLLIRLYASVKEALQSVSLGSSQDLPSISVERTRPGLAPRTHEGLCFLCQYHETDVSRGYLAAHTHAFFAPCPSEPYKGKLQGAFLSPDLDFIEWQNVDSSSLSH